MVAHLGEDYMVIFCGNGTVDCLLMAMYDAGSTDLYEILVQTGLD